ncbi:MAG: hypothetical protein OPY07_06615 [Nitrosopumilus sp.]|nr:hypothetical protein [Nitrosopumilus sp.]
MLTIFTTCKPCNVGGFDKQQRDAMRTWTFLDPKPEVFVIGNDFGTEEICKDFGFKWIPEVEKSDPGGVPYLNSMFEIAQRKAKNDHVALISSDIILFQPLMDCLKACKEKFTDFCAVCRKKQQRDTSIVLDFSSKKKWVEAVTKDLRWNLITSGDLYMFNKGFWKDIPNFVIGRCKCDTWLFWDAARRGQLVDMTDALTIIDFYNTHDHWKIVNAGSKKAGEMERLHNASLAPDIKASVDDANWKILKNTYEIVEAK